MIDYRRFLAPAGSMTLPYLGGPFVDAPDRRLRVQGTVEPGFWVFEVTGRDARAVERAESPDLSGLAAVRGHLYGDYLVHEQSRAELVFLLPEEEPAAFSPAVARRWHSGDLIFESLPFETEAEEQARRAFEEHETLEAIRGIPSTLRAAFSYAMVDRLGRSRGMRVAPAEVRAHLGQINSGGDEACARLLDRLARERALDLSLKRARRAGAVRRSGDAFERAGAALHAAGATLAALRYISSGLLEVTYRFDGERFVSLVDPATLQVVDAGFCLAGEDRLVTLESLPSVIREAIQEGALAITRW